MGQILRLCHRYPQELQMNYPLTTRRGALVGAVAVAATSTLAADKAAASGVGGINAVPPLAAHWNELDLVEILSRPAAYMSVSQNKSVYDPGGVQASEGHRERGSLEATVKVVNAARKVKNFVSFNWIGYEVFRGNYPQSDFDRVQYASWTKGLNFSSEMKRRDNELVGELRALVRPGDNEFNELALQTAFAGTQLPLELARKRIQTIVLTGIHLDWCIEGNARAARDAGYLPIVIGDACGCQKPEQEAAAMQRINNFFAPVISADRFVELLSQRA
ncbi:MULTISPECIES: cysteine hydrolase [unclassified Bradyrhizobium]|uniref:cysteine hydrolase n=1 Tax=unclassified Bradyrhizobium TaxID=2631580 RepID=UPI0028F09ECF|nr:MULTISPECIES: cysteine hydrolase [unclassified Bradyrhizobium]